VAEDDESLGAVYQEVLEARFHRVKRVAGVAETLAALEETDVALLDVQLLDGTAWDVLDRISSPHPQFRVALVTAVATAPPERWSHLPLFVKPLDRAGLEHALDAAVDFRTFGESTLIPPEGGVTGWLERLLLADEPSPLVSIPITLGVLAITTLLMYAIKEEAFGAISAGYTVVVLMVAAFAGLRVGIGAAVLAFVLYDYFTIEPYFTFRIARAELVIDLFSFLAAALIGAFLVGTARRLARHRAAEAAVSRLRLRLLAETMQSKPADLVETATRVIREELSPGTRLELIGDQAPPWVHAADLSRARSERRLVESTWGERPVLLQPAGSDGMVLAASPDAPRLGDLDRRLLSYSVGELGRLLEKAELMEEAASVERLRSQDEAKTALLAAVSHDLRTPLSSMKVAVTAMLGDDIPLTEEQRRRLLETVNVEIDRLAGMVEHLLDLSRLEAGVFRLDREPVDMAKVVWQATDRVRLSSGRVIDVAADRETEVTGDSVRLLEVVTNLVDNASRYSAPATPISVSVRSVADRVLLTVEDQGPGLTEDEVAKLFRPFIRSGSSRGGSGLGLAISRSVVEALGGTISVDSKLGRGTRVEVALPKRMPT
jgi:two-component system sensor histidine kinase KdpD